MQEAADVVGVSILSGAHLGLMKKLMTKMKKNQMDDCLVILGGLIPKADRPALMNLGVQAIFSGGTPAKDVIQFISENVSK